MSNVRHQVIVVGVSGSPASGAALSWAAEEARLRGARLHVVRVTARTGPRGNLLVRSAGGQGSHMLRAMAQANALALLPDGDGVRAGGSVEVMLLDPDVPGPDGADTRWADAPPAVM